MKNLTTFKSNFFGAILQWRNNENIDSKSLGKTVGAILALSLPLFIWMLTITQAFESSSLYLFLYVVCLFIVPRCVMMFHRFIRIKSEGHRAILAIVIGGMLGLLISVLFFGLTLMLLGCAVMIIFS